MAYFGMTNMAGTHEGPFVRSVTGAMKAIREHRVCSCAGDHGAVTLWRDDDGVLRAQFSRYLSTKVEAQFETKKAASDWLKTWLPRVHEHPEDWPH